MSLHEAYEFHRDANVELEFDGFIGAGPGTVSEALATNWERFGS